MVTAEVLRRRAGRSWGLGTGDVDSGQPDWIFGLLEHLLQNSIPCSKIHFYCHTCLLGAGKPGRSADTRFQKGSNSRFHGPCSRIPIEHFRREVTEGDWLTEDDNDHAVTHFANLGNFTKATGVCEGDSPLRGHRIVAGTRAANSNGVRRNPRALSATRRASRRRGFPISHGVGPRKSDVTACHVSER